jgi:uncharacterized protein YbjT (DUF2867 family)
MRVLLFGATGMVGQGVLLECLRDPDVKTVVCIGRSPISQQHQKLGELIRNDFLDYSDIEDKLAGFDACFFCLGVSSVGMSEAAYRRVTYDITLAAAQTVARLNPGMTFIYVSGMGTDSSERGRSMWARVKGKTENDLLRLPFKACCMFRPGVIVPLDGIKSKTGLYNFFLVALKPLLPFLKGRWLKYVTTTEQLGRAMLKISKQGAAPKPILESIDINAI